MHSQCFFSILPFPHLYSSASGNHKPDLFTIRLLVCFFSMLLLLSRFSRVQVCATPEMAAHQAPLSQDSPGKNTGVGCHFHLQCVKVKSLSHVRLFATPWTVAHQLPLSVEFSRQEYWSGLPFPPPGDLPNPDIKLLSPASPALAGRFFTTVPPGKPQRCSEVKCQRVNSSVESQLRRLGQGIPKLLQPSSNLVSPRELLT